MRQVMPQPRYLMNCGKLWYMISTAAEKRDGVFSSGQRKVGDLPGVQQLPQ
jgi:hypothetical protein